VQEVLPVSALEQRQHRSLPRGLSKHLVSDDDLRHLIARRQTTALHLMLYVRKRAVLRGMLRVPVTNVELERELGVDRRQLQRAKAYLREQGFPIVERVGRHRGRTGKSGSLACMFVLDRREVEPLKRYLELVRDEEHGGAVPNAVLVKEENTTPPRATSSSPSVVWWPAAARAGPPPGEAAASTTAHGEPATEAQRALRPPGAGSPERLHGLPAAAQLEPELTKLRSWLSAARGSALSGERATALLDRAVAAVVADGGNPWTARLARALVVEELGLGQLSFRDVPHPSERTSGNAADTSDSGPTSSEGEV
jgi:hypothetical protein